MKTVIMFRKSLMLCWLLLITVIQLSPEKCSTRLFVTASDEVEVLEEKGVLRGADKQRNKNKNVNVVEKKDSNSLSNIFGRAMKKGLGGGVSGALAGVLQVVVLMWMRTVINYQSRYGTTMKQALRILYSEGGVRRFYRGLGFAIIQAPLARFGATAANEGLGYLLGQLESTKHWGAGRVTMLTSIMVGIWRMFLMPIDTCKTVLQVDSVHGFRTLIRKVKSGKIWVLYQGSIANAISSIVASYPWFYVYNFLSNNARVTQFIQATFYKNALIGFVASAVSDTIANSIRVIKTTKQAVATKHVSSYREVISMIVAADGWRGLFGRGLATRIVTNGIQSMLFVVVWRELTEFFNNNNNKKSDYDVATEEEGANSNINTKEEENHLDD